MLGKVVLWVSGIIFTAYGLVCLVAPELPAQYAGLIATSGDAKGEILSMYGGLQTGFGLFCLLGATREQIRGPALLALVMLVGGLAVARLYSVVTVADPVTAYTWGALVFEFATAIVAAIALRQSNDGPAPQRA
jgi:hypothetical protein